MNWLLVAVLIALISCSTVQPMQSSQSVISHDIFWKEMNALCGKAFEGTVINAPANDTAFKNKQLIMHVRSCEKHVVKIPFIVGNNRSRTWVFQRLSGGISLKHDHRHEDGKEDSITQYGGVTATSGSGMLQVFPADEHTIRILPAAITNVWWVELVPGKYFTYNLRRVNTDRLFTIRFDLTKPVTAPQAPWGWKE